MHCPICRHDDTQVVDSRLSEEGATVRRRRQCTACGARFTTYERFELSLPTVVKKDGSRVEFDETKIMSSMKLALRKRSVTADAIDNAVSRIKTAVLSNGAREIQSDKIGLWVMEELALLDKVAYVRFASVYRQFKDVSDFGEVIKQFD